MTTKRPIPPNALDVLIQWLKHQSHRSDKRPEGEAATSSEHQDRELVRATARRTLKRRVVRRLIQSFDFVK